MDIKTPEYVHWKWSLGLSSKFIDPVFHLSVAYQILYHWLAISKCPRFSRICFPIFWYNIATLLSSSKEIPEILLIISPNHFNKVFLKLCIHIPSIIYNTCRGFAGIWVWGRKHSMQNFAMRPYS